MSFTRDNERLVKAGLIASIPAFMATAFSYLQGAAEATYQTIVTNATEWNATTLGQKAYFSIAQDSANFLSMLKITLEQNMPSYTYSKLIPLFSEGGSIKYITDNAFHIAFHHTRAVYEDFIRDNLMSSRTHIMTQLQASGFSYQTTLTVLATMAAAYYLIAPSQQPLPIENDDNSHEARQHHPATDNEDAEESESIEQEQAAATVPAAKVRLFDRKDRMVSVSNFKKFYGDDRDSEMDQVVAQIKRP